MLPRLRSSLDFMPSPYEDKPGLLIRDPFQYTGSTLIVPPALVECLAFFDGTKSALDLRAHLVRALGDLQAGEMETGLTDALSQAGFLEDAKFNRARTAAWKKFAQAPLRLPSHAGAAYPDDPYKLREVITGYMDAKEPPAQSAPVIAIAAPHASPFAAVDSYRAAYSALSPNDADRTFVILGTSHYGQPDRVGLTRKPFVTPYGETLTDTKLVDQLAEVLGPSALMEDYCHAIEHSIEFQVIFLQHLFGPRVRILPILCGPYGHRANRGFPEKQESVRRIFGSLGEMTAREGNRLLWVLGVDMAHMGRRYGDAYSAQAGGEAMQEVQVRDRARIARIEAGDAPGFWELVQENRSRVSNDDLKWCGSAPIYTYLRSVPASRGELLHYQQWNIDRESVVSFAGVRFHSS